MHQDDHLFLRVLMVVATGVAALMSALVLVPPPESAWDGSVSAGTMSLNTVVVRDVSVYFQRSKGPQPFPAPIQTAESMSVLAQRLTTPPLPAPAPRARMEPGPAVVAGPVTVVSLDVSSTRASPPALEDPARMRGGDGSVGERNPARALARLEMPHPPERLILPEEQIVAFRPAFPHARPGLETPRSGLEAQDSGQDPLPEFRRFMPRFQACARDVSRRSRQPLRGKVILRVTVGEEGNLKDARVVGGSLHDPDANQCLLNVLATEPFFSRRPEPVTADRAVIFTG